MRHDPAKLCEDILEHEILWDIVENKIPTLKRDIHALG